MTQLLGIIWLQIAGKNKNSTFHRVSHQADVGRNRYLSAAFSVDFFTNSPSEYGFDADAT